MKIYLVGGCIRDRLLGIKDSDKDYCVTGATPEEMQKLGFKQCGKDFPVFLHPKTNEEYALARTERKNGHGYTGFISDFSKDITIEEDLLRRDLTINAIASPIDDLNTLIDPSNGLSDLKNKILRHVSDAFIEDPLRVLRLARFYARFYYLGFSVAPETVKLCKDIARSGELKTLTPQRIWLETQKALKTKKPEKFFEFLKETHALEDTIPEVYNLIDVVQREIYHPEGDVFNHTMLTLKEITKLTDYTPTRFAMLCHDFGKSLTIKEDLPDHPKHYLNGKTIIKSMASRLGIPNEYADLAIKISQTHSYVDFLNKSGEVILNTFLTINGYKNPMNVTFLAQCLNADFRGVDKEGPKEFYTPYYLIYLFNKSLKVKVQDVINDGFKDKAISEELNRRRIMAINEGKEELLKLYGNLK